MILPLTLMVWTFKWDGLGSLCAPFLIACLDLVKVLGRGIDGEDNLAGLDTGCCSDSLAEREAHPLGYTVCTCAGCLLVLAEHVVREDPDLEVEVGPADIL